MPTRYAPSKSFDPELAEAMGAAFEAALASLQQAGLRADWAREMLALHIIETAQAGERDVTRLRDDALAYLANAKIQTVDSRPQESGASLSRLAKSSQPEGTSCR